MSNQNCPKCGKPVPDNVNLCPSCGNKLKSKAEITTEEQQIKKTQTNENFGYIIGLVSIIGIIVMFAYRAWLGGIIYAIAAGLSIVELNNQYSAENNISISDFIKKKLKITNIGEKILIIVAVLLPIIVIIATYRWIFVDTVREVNDMSNYIDSLF